MTREILERMLAEVATGNPENGIYTFKQVERLSAMVALDGALITVDRVNSVQLRDGYVVLTCDRAEQYVIELARLVGLKVQRPTAEGPGFVGR